MSIDSIVSGPIDADEMFNDVSTLARWTKVAGTATERASLSYVQSRMQAAGYRTTIIEHDAYISIPGRARLVVAGREFDCITHPFARPTGGEGLAADIVYVDRGAAKDYAGRNVAGRIVVVEGMATPQAAFRATSAGAVGQIHISPDEHMHEMCISPVWGSPSGATIGMLPATAVVTVSGRDRAAILAAVSAGASATIHAEVDTRWIKTPILLAELSADRARNPDGHYVLFSGHHDTWYEGVMDNGSANATMIQAAKACADSRPHWNRDLKVAFWSGHSQGRYSGSAWFADTHWNDLNERCVAHVNIDSTGAAGADVLDSAGCSSELNRVARDAIKRHAGQEHKGCRMDRWADHSFWGAGVPSMLGVLSSQPDTGANPNSLGWWWHTSSDTLDKISKANLARDAAIYRDILGTLLVEAIIPVDAGAQIADLARQIAAIDPGPDDLLAGLAETVDRCVALCREISAVPTGRLTADQVREVNAQKMRISRLLVPLDYTSGDPFDPDPALPQSPWPVLDPVRRYADAAADSAMKLHLRIDAVRSRNRVLHAATQVRRHLQAWSAVLAGQ